MNVDGKSIFLSTYLKPWYKDRRGSLLVFCKVGVLTNVPQNSQENTCTEVSFIKNIFTGLQP